MDLGLAGRVCLVTGADRPLGLATARLLRAEDAKVLLVGRDAEALADTAEGLDGGEEEIATLPLDPTVVDAGEQMLAAASEEFGGIDALVVDSGGEGAGGADSDWRAAYQNGVKAPLRAMKAIAPVLAERGWGRIVVVCPIAAPPAAPRPESVPGGPAAPTAHSADANSVAAAAGLALTRLFAERYAPRGVLINALCPPAPGTRPDPEELARSIAFLCSERASYLAGAAVPISPAAGLIA
jgi:3-oxoacyl-[acyl-carrier protein] reductase